MNMLYEICWTGHVQRFFQLKWSKNKKIKNKSIKNKLFFCRPDFWGSPTLSPQPTIGFELKTSHLTLNTVTNSLYLEFHEQRDFSLHIHLQFYLLPKHIKPLTSNIFFFPSYAPHTPKHINIPSLFVSTIQILQISKHIYVLSYF